MGRKRSSTRRTPKARPQGVLELAPDGFGFVTTAEGEFFIPASKLSLGFVSDEELNNWVGKSVEARVITAEKDGRKLVLSSKEILREKEAAERKEAAAAVKPNLA